MPKHILPKGRFDFPGGTHDVSLSVGYDFIRLIQERTFRAL